MSYNRSGAPPNLKHDKVARLKNCSAHPMLNVYPSTPLALTGDDLAAADTAHTGTESLLSVSLSTANSMGVMHGRLPGVYISRSW